MAMVYWLALLTAHSLLDSFRTRFLAKNLKIFMEYPAEKQNDRGTGSQG